MLLSMYHIDCLIMNRELFQLEHGSENIKTVMYLGLYFILLINSQKNYYDFKSIKSFMRPKNDSNLNCIIRIGATQSLLIQISLLLLSCL